MADKIMTRRIMSIERLWPSSMRSYSSEGRVFDVLIGLSRSHAPIVMSTLAAWVKLALRLTLRLDRL